MLVLERPLPCSGCRQADDEAYMPNTVILITISLYLLEATYLLVTINPQLTTLIFSCTGTLVFTCVLWPEGIKKDIKGQLQSNFHQCKNNVI